MADEILYTLLKDACSGEGVHDVFVVAAVHPEDFPLDTVSLLVHVDLSQNPPSIRTLLNARQEIDDEEDCSSFECLTRDGEVLYIGNSGGDGIAYAHGEVTRLAFKQLRPRPGGTYSACRLGAGHVLFGTFAGVIVDFQSGQVAAHRVFEDGSYLSVNALQSLGDDFVIAVGGNGCVSRFDGSNWYAVDAPTRDRFLGVWCRSRTDVYFAAEALWHWDGRRAGSATRRSIWISRTWTTCHLTWRCASAMWRNTRAWSMWRRAFTACCGSKVIGWCWWTSACAAL